MWLTGRSVTHKYAVGWYRKRMERREVKKMPFPLFNYFLLCFSFAFLCACADALCQRIFTSFRMRFALKFLLE